MQKFTAKSSLAYLAWSVLALTPPDSAVAQEVHDPADVKAAFLYHFSTFVSWPGENPEEEPFTIAVLGDDAVARQLERYLPGRRIEGRPMRVVRIGSVTELDHAEVLFVGAARADELEWSAKAVRDEPVLVVSDAPEALDLGAMINFTIIDRRLQFEISLSAAQRAGLSLSSRLLEAALQVRTGLRMNLRQPPLPVLGLRRRDRHGPQPAMVSPPRIGSTWPVTYPESAWLAKKT